MVGWTVKEHTEPPVLAPFEGTVQTPPFFRGSPVRVVDQNIVPVGFRALLCPALEGGVEGVGDVGNDTGESFGLLSPQTLGDPVRDIPKGFSRVQYLKLGSPRDRRVTNPVQHHRDGRLRELREFSDVFLGGTHGGWGW